MEMLINVVVVVVVVVVVLVYNGTFWRELVASHHGMAAFDRTGEEWVQKENVFIG